MLLSDPPHSLHQAQKKIMTQCSSNYTKWESFRSHHSLCCALSALQPPRAGRGSTIPLQQCWITQDGRGSQTLPPLKFLFSLLGTTLLIALPCRFCSLPSVTSRLQLQEVPRSEVCQMYASPASPSSTTVPHLHMNTVLPRGCCHPTDILMASGAHSHVRRLPKAVLSLRVTNKMLKGPEELQYFPASLGSPCTTTFALLSAAGPAPQAGPPVWGSPPGTEGGLQERGEPLLRCIESPCSGTALPSPLVQLHDPRPVQTPPQLCFQQHVVVGVEHQWLLLWLVVMVGELLVVGCDEPVGTDLWGDGTGEEGW